MAGDLNPTPAERLRRPLRQLAVFWYASPWLTLVSAALVPLVALASVATLWATGRLVDALVGRQGMTAALVWLCVVCGTLLVWAAAESWSGPAWAALTSRVFVRTAALVADTAAAPHGIEHLESGETVPTLTKLSDSLHDAYAVHFVESTWTVYQARLKGISAAVLVATWCWPVALLLAAAESFASLSFDRWINAASKRFGGVSRTPAGRAEYFRRLSVSRKAAKEIRLFGILDWVLDRQRHFWHQGEEAVLLAARPKLRRVYLAGAICLVSYVVSYWWLGASLWTGAISPGHAFAVLQSVGMFSLFGSLGDPQRMINEHQVQLETLAAVRRELGLADLRHLSLQPPPALEARGAATVRVSDVTFTYPTRTDPVFAGLDLVVPAGQSLGVVGVNGAGKSTLIKLIAGLYRPDSGTISIDGDDPGVSDAARRRVAVIFQTFAHYPDPLVDNVALALPGSAVTRERAAREALHRAAADSLLTRVGGLGTVLSDDVPGGTELSGGQWQRVALARALAAVDAGAGVLILDEPSAALDVRAEAELFDRFLEVTKGVTTILVSHRLSSVRRADRIVVIDGGRIVEDGSHDELLALGGRYARAFALQATRFAAAGAATSSRPDEEVDHA